MIQHKIYASTRWGKASTIRRHVITWNGMTQLSDAHEMQGLNQLVALNYRYKLIVMMHRLTYFM